jgi:hypothetical protein
MASSAGKRQRERQKLEKAQAKAVRKAARVAADVEPEGVSAGRSESELIDDLGALHRAFEAGEVSPGDFEEHRDRLQAEFDRLS